MVAKCYMDRFLTRGLQALGEAHVRDFLAEPHVAVVAWSAPSGGLRTTPVWYHYIDGVVWLVTESSAAKTAALRRNPNVSLTIDRRDEAPQAVTIQGHAEVLAFDEQIAERLIARYLGPEAAPAYRAEMMKHMEMACIRITPHRATWIDLAPMIQELIAR